jgi:rhamnosyl/mannosyltransferase
VGAIVHEKNGYPKPNPDDFGGAKIYSVPTYGQLLYAPVAPSFPWRLRQAIRDFKPDILHLHMPNTSVFAALLLPEARRIPWVVHWHADVDVDVVDWDWRLRIAYQFYQPMERAVLRAARFIVATSEAYADASIPLTRWREKVRVIPLFIDATRMPEVSEQEVTEARALWPNPEGIRLLAVGRLVKFKGFDRLIDCVRDVAGAGLLIVGDGPLRSELTTKIRTMNLESRVKIISAMSWSHRSLGAIFAAATMLCVTSVDRSESFGIAPLEAAHYRTPVLAVYIKGSGLNWVVEQLCSGVVTDIPSMPGKIVELTARKVSSAISGIIFPETRSTHDQDTVKDTLRLYDEC